MLTGLAVKTADGEILAIVRTDTKHESLVKRDVEDLIQEHTGGVHTVEYNPEEIEYTAKNFDGEQQTFYVEEVRII